MQHLVLSETFLKLLARWLLKIYGEVVIQQAHAIAGHSPPLSWRYRLEILLEQWFFLEDWNVRF